MPRNNSTSRKAERRESAVQRQVAYAALSDDDKLAQVAARVDDVTRTNEFVKLNKKVAS
jgi:hypothetical protein